MFDQAQIVHRLKLAMEGIRNKQRAIEGMVDEIQGALTEVSREVEEVIQMVDESADHARIQTLIKKKVKLMTKSIKQEQKASSSISKLTDQRLPKMSSLPCLPEVKALKMLKKLKKRTHQKLCGRSPMSNLCDSVDTSSVVPWERVSRVPDVDFNEDTNSIYTSTSNCNRRGLTDLIARHHSEHSLRYSSNASVVVSQRRGSFAKLEVNQTRKTRTTALSLIRTSEDNGALKTKVSQFAQENSALSEFSSDDCEH